MERKRLQTPGIHAKALGPKSSVVRHIHGGFYTPRRTWHAPCDGLTEMREGRPILQLLTSTQGLTQMEYVVLLCAVSVTCYFAWFLFGDWLTVALGNRQTVLWFQTPTMWGN